MATLQKWMDITANNMANANTTGFKQDRMLFNDQLQSAVDANGASVGGLGSGAVPRSEYADLTDGSVMPTGDPLNVAISGPGMFQVQTTAGVRFTRDGAFKISPTRQLTTSGGDPLLDSTGKTIELAPGAAAIDAEGNVLVNGQPQTKLLIYSGTFQKEGGNLFSSNDSLARADINLHVGAVEASNVNVIEAMTDMIKLGRNFELSQKSIQTQDDMTEKLIQSLSSR